MFRFLPILALIFLASFIQSSHAFTIASWNAEQGSVEFITRRQAQIKELGEAIKTKHGSLPNVLVLQEITSFAAAQQVAKALGYTDVSIVTSDSGNDRKIWPFALEIAVISKKKILKATSYQSRANSKFPPYIQNLKSGDISYGEVKKVQVPSQVKLPGRESIPRAIVRVELEGNVVVYGVHFNSSGLGFCRLGDTFREVGGLKRKATALGLSDHADNVQKALDAIKTAMKTASNPGIEATKQENLRRARSREAAAGAIVQLADADIKAGHSVFVAGDFNTPLNEPCKTGKKLNEDFEPLVGCRTGITPNTCGNKDGFDDTYAILTDGLVGTTRFRVLTKDLDKTYVKSGFVNSPIDNILVAGPLAQAKYEVGKIVGTKRNGTIFGSDHFAIVAQKK